MGWKAASIIISNVTTVDAEKLLQELGFEQFTTIDDEPYDVAVYPEKCQIFIGVYKNNLIISSWEITDHSFGKELSTFEQKLSNLFPASEICTIQLHSGVNHWGYAIVKNGEKIRVRCGNADQGTIIELGEPLLEEQELLSKSEIKDGRRIYHLRDDEPYEEDQVGENFVSSIWARYTGKEFFEDEDMFEFMLSGFKTTKAVSSTQPTHKQQSASNQQSVTDQQSENTNVTKPWWKFW